MDKLEKLLHSAHVRFQRSRLGDCDVDSLAEAIRKRVPRMTKTKSMIDHEIRCKQANPAMQWQKRVKRAKLFCIHEKLMLEDCKKCGRKGVL